ncbi:hypothetical protein [Zavarzinia aquatilis]|uniref:Uncharacterized protein n=1 Tax=Zavarzinia aquatilis TaxID=2211142 RepID=A0A317EI54_9PROT|nr:hypothetical protein [Zavarzinia aquatilis]PWR25976.1 hypothetical protein DKG74_03245 [Zavarzinia aquatilis]
MTRVFTAIPLLIAAIAAFVAWWFLAGFGDAPPATLLLPREQTQVWFADARLVSQKANYESYRLDIDVVNVGTEAKVLGYEWEQSLADVARVLGDEIEDGFMEVRFDPERPDIAYRGTVSLFQLAGGLFALAIFLLMLPVGVTVLLAVATSSSRDLRLPLRLYAVGVGALSVVLGLGIAWSFATERPVRLLDRFTSDVQTAVVEYAGWRRQSLVSAAPSRPQLLRPEISVSLATRSAPQALRGLDAVLALPGETPPLPLQPGQEVRVTIFPGDDARLVSWPLRPLSGVGIGLGVALFGGIAGFGAAIRLRRPRRAPVSRPRSPLRRIGG